jgi:hypothetical protein
MAPVAMEGGASLSVVVIMGACERSKGTGTSEKPEPTHREGDVCGTTESLGNLRGLSPTSDGRRDELENDESTFATGAIVMCTV